MAQQAVKFRDLRIFFAIGAATMLALFFWLSSRYPALNQKALMGGDTPVSGLSFDILIEIFPGSSVWWEIVANTANWIYTNLKGMTFGVLFGAAALTILSLIKKRSFDNGFANAALGSARRWEFASIALRRLRLVCTWAGCGWKQRSLRCSPPQPSTSL